MKKYFTPEMTMIMTVYEDILTVSNGGENGDPLNVDYDMFFKLKM